MLQMFLGTQSNFKETHSSLVQDPQNPLELDPRELKQKLAEQIGGFKKLIEKVLTKDLLPIIVLFYHPENYFYVSQG